MKRIEICENKIHFVLEINDENEAKLLHFSAMPFDEKNITSRTGTVGFRLVEINLSGIDRPYERHGNKYIVTAPGYRMKFKDFTDTANQLGRKLEITTFDEPTGIEAVSHFQFFSINILAFVAIIGSGLILYRYSGAIFIASICYNRANSREVIP